MPVPVFQSLRQPWRPQPQQPLHLLFRPCAPRPLRRSLAALLAAATLPLAVVAEPAPRARPDPADPTAAVPSATYASSLARYRRHAEQPVRSWRDANETVNRIGGWRAYAREAASPQPPQSTAPAPAPAPLARPAVPAAPAAAAAQGGSPSPAPAASQPATHGGRKH
jgi:hypothetical protein